MDSEFLYTKDPLFFSKPRTIEVEDEETGDILCFRTFVTDECRKPENIQTERFTPYEDNDSTKFCIILLYP